jgi:2-octaprenyl-6-methoxyphenol hydroxylase
VETDYDVIVVGGGMVGASLACALAPLGLRIGVVEAVPLTAAAQPSYDDRTVALAWGSRRIFEGIGVWDEIARLGATPIERIHISDRGHFGCTRLSAADLGREALGYVVENRVLGAALLARLQASTDVAWLCPARLEKFEPGDDLATVTIRQDDQSRTLRARLVIGADGADSVVRAAAGIAAKRTDYDQTAVVTNVTPERPHANTAYERFTETGPLALLPMNDCRPLPRVPAPAAPEPPAHRCAVVWSARAGEVQTILGWSDDEYLAQLQARFGDRLGRLTKPGKRMAYPLKLTRVPEQAKPRLVVIGNAAHTVHPVAGQGFNLGLRDVAALAEALADALRNGEDIGALGVLQRYAARRMRDNRVTQAFTHGLIRVFANDFPPLVLARNLGLVAVDLLPPVKRAFVRVTSGLAGRLPRLARGLPL